MGILLLPLMSTLKSCGFHPDSPCFDTNQVVAYKATNTRNIPKDIYEDINLVVMIVTKDDNLNLFKNLRELKCILTGKRFLKE